MVFADSQAERFRNCHCSKRYFGSRLMMYVDSVLAYFAFEPLGKLPQMTQELSIEVLNSSFNFAFVLRVRRMRIYWRNTMPTAPVFPVIFKLFTVIRKYLPWPTLLPHQ
jgi:hypothetical protein